MALLEPVLLSRATRPPPHRVAIPHVLQGKQLPETPLKFEGDPTVGSKVMPLSNRYSSLERRDLRLTEYDSTSTRRKTASGKSCKNLKAIQRSDEKLWPFRTGTMVSSDETTASPSSDSTSTTRKTASRKSCANLNAIQRSDQKLWPFRTGTLVSSDETPASPCSDSTFTPRKTASRKSCKNLTAIQRSDQKLWPFPTGTRVSSDETSA
jgi:hypothetical protein